MHVTLMTAGSRGDVQPYIALAKALNAQGHETRLVAPDSFADLAEHHGVTLTPLESNFDALLNGEVGEVLMGSSTNMIKAMRSIRDIMQPVVKQMTADALDATHDTDAIISQAAVAMFAQTIAEKRGLPLFNSALAPLAPTRAHPSPMWLSHSSLGGFFNRLTGQFMERSMWWLLSPTIKQLREELDLDEHSAGSYFDVMDRMPTLSAFSPSFYPRPRDYGRNVHITGYWFLDDESYAPEQAVVDFLDVGDAPIYIGFGSMVNNNPSETAQIVLEALQETGQRGVLLTAWGGMQAEDVPDDVLVVDDVSHPWLFPHMSAVIHHGGAGTTGNALRAGVPQIIIPHVADQFFWGKHVAEKGLGYEPIPRKAMNVHDLVQAIRTVTYDMPMRDRAKQMGQRVRAEKGTQVAIGVLERLVAEFKR
jgi:sterol 3beta-glucosyltransferase